MTKANEQPIRAEAACSQCGSSDAETIRHIMRRGWGGSTRNVQLHCNRCGTIYEGASEPAMKNFRVMAALLAMFFLIGIFLAFYLVLSQHYSARSESTEKTMKQLPARSNLMVPGTELASRWEVLPTKS